MSIAQEIRDAIRAAQAAAEPRPDDPYKRTLDEIAEGLTDENVKASIRSQLGGRYTLWLAPTPQPGRATPVLQVVISETGADVLLDPKQVAKTPKELTDILKKFVTSVPFLETLQEIAGLTTQPVEGFLRVTPGTVSREDLMLEVPPETQREIATYPNGEVSLLLKVASFPGAGTFKPDARYTILESAGISVTLSQNVKEEPDGGLRIVGRINAPASS